MKITDKTITTYSLSQDELFEFVRTVYQASYAEGVSDGRKNPGEGKYEPNYPKEDMVLDLIQDKIQEKLNEKD